MKPLSRFLLALLLLAGVLGPAPAAQDPPNPAPAEPASPTPRATPVPGPPATPATPREDPLEEFVPQEHVPADSAVAFPVDI
jgi:hypothetical protein